MSAEASRAPTHGERLLATMTLIRRFEERLLEWFSEGRLAGTAHTSIGQEANAAAILAALEPTDIVVSGHRGHGHFLAHTGAVEGLLSEIFGRETGACGGVGGSQHLHYLGRFYSNGIQGGVVPFAVGAALAERRLGRSTVVVCYLGDGTMGQGVVYEAWNLAALWRAPVLFVIEHNGIAQTTPTELVQAGDFCERARGFGLHATELVHPEVEELGVHARALIERCRAGNPSLLQVHSVRLGPHSKGDETRPDAVMEKQRARDPLARLVSMMTPASVERAERDARACVESALRAVLDAPFPKPAPVPPSSSCREAPTRGADEVLSPISGVAVATQLNQALHRVFALRRDVVLLGQDVLDPYGGAFKVTRGLSTAFPERVLASPVSEAALAGVAGGMAVRGLRPVVEVMFGDFLALCADQIVNHACKWPLMFEGVRCPLIVRTPMGGRRGYGPTHSQTLERLLLGTPGLTVFAPSHVHDSGACLEAAIADGGPVLFIENKDLYGRRVVLESGRVNDFEVRYLGDDPPVACLSLTGFAREAVTIYGYGGMAPHVMDAALALLVEHEVSVRIVLPARLHTVPRALLGAAWADGSAVLAVEESNADFGFGAEVLASLVESGHRVPRAARLGARAAAIPASRRLEDDILPQSRDIVARALSLVPS